MNHQAQDTVAQWMAESASQMIQARILRHLPELIRELGGHPDAALKAFDLDCEICEIEGAVSCRQWVGVLDRAAAQLKIDDLGMRLAERQGGTALFGPLGNVMRNCRNFGESLTYAATHNAAHSLGTRVWMGRTMSGQSVFMGHELLAEAISSRSQAIEHALLAGHLAARSMTGGHVGARRVHFRHKAISRPSVYRRYFQCDVRFCCNEDGVAFAAEDLLRPIFDPDKVSLTELIERIEREYGTQRPAFQALVRSVVMQLLWTGNSAVEDVSHVLDLHSRALHRRLQAEHCTFQTIKDEVRRDVLMYYLRYTALPLGRISEKLGFSEQSAMSRFARTHLNATPRQLRQSSGQPDAFLS
ncbi:AraC family transcriptional regulator ligand-binding domain-containing protein [Novosphingobium sp. ST904]|uniref:AraC family transcriptional regulator ligand-binding domain-containing protein n=1 Tax=Novosphingobium sp. ST904 TaxID=1684385 RepID=UPI0006C8A67A|nr:AraC family transcriptional regulator ligand-binding domain-containing protein [Novosphingobium sp. ST904]TCM27767.1 AraC-like DNA-binding protein [Novosphingobium sp. ST904]